MYKKYFTITALLILSFSALLAQEKAYTINGKFLKPTDLKSINFIQKESNGSENSKKIAVSDNSFTIEGTIKENSAAILQFGADTNQVLFFLDEGVINIAIADKLSDAKITGSQTTADFKDFLTGEEKFLAQFQTLSDQAEGALKQGNSQDEVGKNYYKSSALLKQQYLDYHRKFISDHRSSYISLIIIPKLAEYTQNYIESDSLLNVLSPELKTSPTGVSISKTIGKEKKTSIGAVAPDFSLADTAGKAVALSSLKGKYVLLDFWASWCGPCRQENPNVVSVYQQYKDKGFTVFGVSLDQDKKGWIKAINNDRLSWSHVSDLKSWNNAAAVLYGITAIPRNFLLDPNGKIIARDLRGAELQMKMEELFN